MPSPAHFAVGDRVVTAHHGSGKIKTYYQGRVIGPIYTVALDRPAPLVQYVQGALEPESVVVQLAAIVGDDA